MREVATLGGSATAREITTQLKEDLAHTDEMLAVGHINRPEASVYLERVHWARSQAKLIGALVGPKQGVFLITPAGSGTPRPARRCGPAACIGVAAHGGTGDPNDRGRDAH